MSINNLPVEDRVRIASWNQFEDEIQNLNLYRDEANRKEGPQFREPWDRGMANYEWGMQTTLERSHPSESSREYTSVKSYYEKALAAKPAVETFTNRRWDRIPDVNAFETALNEHWSGIGRDVLVEQPEMFEYLIYLRHHGFPSPLLDWTASPLRYFSLSTACQETPNMLRCMHCSKVVFVPPGPTKISSWLADIFEHISGITCSNPTTPCVYE